MAASIDSRYTVPDFLTFWGKADPNVAPGPRTHPLAYHLLDVAMVAEAILERRPLARTGCANLLGLQEADAQQLIVTLAALHDLGKFAPAFQRKAETHWPSCLGACDHASIVNGRHTEDGFVLWQGALARVLEHRIWPGNDWALMILAPAIFGHHGYPVGNTRRTHPRQRFGETGTRAAMECAESIVSMLCPSPIAAECTVDEAGMRAASWWVAGLMTIADWIGSNVNWFPYREPDGDCSLRSYLEYARRQALSALRHAGALPPGVAPARPFGDLTGVRKPPTPAQQWAAEVELSEGSLLVIIEDVTGAGKTEAAQMIVHRLMAEGRASGAYWALPTQATANAMYDRQAAMLDALFVDGCDPKPSLVLAHGQQRLRDKFRATVLGTNDSKREGTQDNPISERSDELPGAVACAAFLADDRRAAFLADIGAGTVDQAILGVLPTKFNAVRLFGLSEKVLVIDEAHAYDAYMGVEIQELLRFHRTLGGCAIVLSATLDQTRRKQLLAAWRSAAVGGPLNRSSPTPVRPLLGDAYPLATVASATRVLEYPIEPAPQSRRRVPVRLVHDIEQAVRHVADAVRAGAAVAWIRNTVDDCLEATKLLGMAGVDAVVFHARFAQVDRQRIEQDVLVRVGKESTSANRNGIAIVATQVIEQSLDIDFDVMVTDVAPIDLLIQRAGRLWRHDRAGARPAEIRCELVVFSPVPDENPSSDWLGGVFKGTSAVYGNAGILWRTVRVLDQVKAIESPLGMRTLVGAVYDNSDAPDSLLSVSERAQGKELGNAATAKYATLKARDGYDASAREWESDLRVSTRVEDDLPDTIIRLARLQSDGSLAPWADDVRPLWKAWALSEVRVSGRKVPPDAAPDDRHAAAIARAKATWGRFELELRLLPLTQVGDAWTGTLVIPSKKNVLSITYSKSRGLAFNEPKK